MLHAEASASPAMHLQMDHGIHPSPSLPMPTVSHQVLEVPHCISQMWGMTFWIDQLKSRLQGPQFFLSNSKLPGTDLRPATGKYQSPTLSAPTFPFPQFAPALQVQASTCWKSLDSSQWSLSVFCHCHWHTGFPTGWTWYISSLCSISIRRYRRYPHPQAWGWSPAQLAPTGWLSQTVEPLPSRSTAARSIVPRGIGRLVYETWQEFVSPLTLRSVQPDTLKKNAKNMLFLHVPGRSKTTLLLLSHRNSMEPKGLLQWLKSHDLSYLKVCTSPVHLSQHVCHPASRDDNGHSKFRLPLTQWTSRTLFERAELQLSSISELALVIICTSTSSTSDLFDILHDCLFDLHCTWPTSAK